MLKTYLSKADKGNAIVIQDKSEYLSKISELLKSGKKFKKLNKDLTITRDRSLYLFLNKLLKKGSISKEVRDQLSTDGPRAGVLYGLPKVHKDDTPLRPIISAVGTYNFNLAKYLDQILKPLVDQEYMLKDTFDFVNKITNINPDQDKYMASFDVESLFTNIPTNETIKIILDLAFKDIETFNGLNRSELEKLLTICTQESHFQFNGEIFDQIDGVAMGSPLGPLFANIFMSEFERKHMNKLKELGIRIWNTLMIFL